MCSSRRISSRWCLIPALGLDGRIRNMRTHVAREFGVVMPEIRLTDDPGLASGMYRINIHGVEQAHGTLRPKQLLALVDEAANHSSSDLVSEPVYGAPALWIDQSAQEKSAMDGQTVVIPVRSLGDPYFGVFAKEFKQIADV